MRHIIDLAQTTLLAGLVICSLLLTMQIWTGAALKYSVTERDYDYRPAPASIQPAQLRDLIRPQRVLVHFDQYSVAFHSGFVGYESFWTPVRSMLLKLTPQPSRVDQVTSSVPAIEMILPHPLAADFWVRIWHGDYDSERWDDETVSRIIVIPASNALVLIDASGKPIAEYKIESSAQELFAPLSELIDEVYSARLPAYVQAECDVPGLSIASNVYVPDRPPALARILTQAETTVPDGVAEMFFADLSAAHRLTEQDRAYIYTDGQKAVRVYPAGAVEYNAVSSGMQPPQSPVDAVITALSFLADKGDLPQTAYLSRIDNTESDTHIEFSYSYLGLPIYADGGTIIVRMLGTNITEYRRFVRIPVGASKAPAPIIDWRFLLPAIADIMVITTDHTDKVTDMYLAYVLPDRSITDAMLVPAWIVHLASGTTLWFDAHSGEGWIWTGHEQKLY